LWYSEIVRRCGERGIGAVHTGRSGNLTISWPGHDLMRDLILGFRWMSALREARGLARQGIRSSPAHALARGVLATLPPALWRVAYRLNSKNDMPIADPPWSSYSLIRPEFAQEQKVMERARALGHDFTFRSNSGGRTKALTLVNQPADTVRCCEASFGVQVRTPADDARVIDFCLSIPEEQCCRDGVTRWLIRRAMRGVLPESILHGTRRGYQAADWFQRLIRFRPRVIDEIRLLETCEEARHCLDLPRLRQIVETLPEDPSESPRREQLRGFVEGALTAGMFLRWIENGSPEA
jgi:asparagine synthase (glutamine-hydrolysing)